MIKRSLTGLSIFFIILLLSFPRFASAQDIDREEIAGQLLEQANIVLRDQPEAWEVIRQLLEQAYEFQPDNVEINYKLGLNYLQNVERGKSVPYLMRVYESDPDYVFNLLYLIGQGYQYQSEFLTASEYYDQYLQKLSRDTRYRGADRTPEREVQRRIYECSNGLEFKNNPYNYKIINVGPAINTAAPEYGPVINQDETLMVFTSRRQENNLNEDVDADNFYFEDIYISRKVNGNWTRAGNIGSMVNTRFHDSNLALSADGSQLYVYKDENQGDIYVSQLVSDFRSDSMIWSEPIPLDENINSESYTEGSISISPDKKVLFFASDRPGGYGGLDIYVSRLDSRGRWGKSENLGAQVNTEFDDDAPFIDYDGKTLYFSSKGRKGVGGYDIFRTEYDSAREEWSAPENMGFPINTPDDDIYYVSTEDGKRGYYASVKEDGYGFTDIYMISLDTAANQIMDDDGNGRSSTGQLGNVAGGPGKANITGVELGNQQNNGVVDTTAISEDASAENVNTTTGTENNTSGINGGGDGAGTSDDTGNTTADLIPVTLLVKVVDKQDGTPVDAALRLAVNGGETYNGAAQGDGIYKFSIPATEAKTYMLSADKAGYAFSNFRVNLPASIAAPQEFKRLIELQRLRTGYSQVLRNVYFLSGTATFTEDSFDELNKLLQMMQSNPALKIELGGHTDNVGPADYNKKLSERRAQAVKNYLVEKGIDAARITAVGYGEERPLASNDDELEGRELNRRVELKVLQ